jgi:hypothetical protein
MATCPLLGLGPPGAELTAPLATTAHRPAKSRNGAPIFRVLGIGRCLIAGGGFVLGPPGVYARKPRRHPVPLWKWLVA